MDAGANQFSGIYGIHNNSSQTELAFVTTGTEKVRIDTNGNVGIGTTAPNQKLEVSGNALVTGYLRVGANSGGSGVAGDIVARRSSNTGAYYFGDSSSNYLYFDGTNYQFGNAGLYVKTDGNVGIGTVSPGYQLEVKGTGLATDGILLSTSAYTSIPNPGTVSNSIILNPRGFGFSTDGATLSSGYQPTLGIGLAINRSEPALAVKNSTGAALAIEAGGIAIGNGSVRAGAVLDVYGNIVQNWANNFLGTQYADGSQYQLGLNTDITNRRLYIDSKDSDSVPTRASIQFRTGATPSAVMTIQQNGNVGIGTTSPAALLAVHTNSDVNTAYFRGSSNTNYILQIDNNGGLAKGVLITGGNSLDSNATLLRVEQDASTPLFTVSDGNSYFQNGNVGIGTTSPWKKLSVEGGVAINGLTAAAGTPSALCLSASKEMVVNTGTSNCTVSSAQFKHDIETLTTEEAKRIVLGIEPVSFKYNGTNEPRLGFIAEQIETIEPRLVARDTDGSPRSVHYAEITAVLSAVVKEHQSNFDLLQSGNEPSWFVESVRRVLSQVTELTATIFTANEIYVRERLCVGDTCITESDLQELLLLKEGVSQNGSTGDDSGGTAQDNAPEDTPVDTTAPTIIMQGNNPALLTVGESYADLGAVATDDSGIATLRTYYLGTEVTAVQIDTTQVMEHIITYVARDLTGNTATSTRTVIVSAGEGADEGPAEAPQP
jgi:hypothetical protein